MSTTSKGKRFENQVAELYRLMRYEVKQNVGILGHQIDILLAYIIPGGIKTKIAVECKYVEKGNITKNSVMNNINALIDLKRNNIVQHLIIVTNNGFAKDIWDTAEVNDIQLLTFRELQHRIVNFDQYLDRLIKDFETDELSEYYIDPIVQDDEKVPREIFDLSERYINKWIKTDEINHLSILGEYGIGKTTFCRKLAHDLAVRYRKDPLNNRIPILINLRDYSKSMNIQQLITDLFIDKYGFRELNFPLFEKMNEDGLFLLIFDGFDEMTQKISFDVAYSNFFKISELTKSKKSKVILTCRTEFFRTREQEKEILLDIDKLKNFTIIYMREFDDEQIRKFLEKRVPLIKERKKKQDWGYYYQKIQEIFDLKDLAKRPVLLELIVKHLPQLIEKEEHIKASTLYLTTIQKELKRRIKIGKTIIQREDRIKLMKLLATWMYNHDKLAAYHEEIPKLINLKVHFDLKTQTDIEYHLNDFLTCSFLSRDGLGNYRFSHRSFVDFLVACKFVDDIKNDFKNNFIQKAITYEVIQFMKELGVSKEMLYEWIISTKNKSFSETQFLGGNAVSILNEFGENFANRRFDFSETILDYADFHGQDLRGLNFTHASLCYANLKNTNLLKVNFSFSNLKGVTFGEMDEIFCICWSSDGKYLLSGNGSGMLEIWDAESLEEFTTLEGHSSRIYSVAFSPDGKYLASDSTTGTIKIWDAESLEEFTTLEGHTLSVISINFSLDGKYLASGSSDNTVKIWDMNTFQEVATLEGHTYTIYGVAFSPDGKYLASGSMDKTVKIWDMNTFQEVATFRGHALYFYSVAFSPDGKYLASGNYDKTVKIWDMNTFQEVATLEGHADGVYSVAFSPDGKYLASGSWDKTVKIWDMDTFREIDTFRGHKKWVWGIAFSPDGKYLASGSNDKTIRIWHVDPKSRAFGESHCTIKQIKCKGMIIRGVKGLDREKIRFFKKQGARE
ncbi:MAG: NACHT domain-containing protein [Theionarchaea archaeon]|nr:NACHT domain-containing protein [Theionarchaea archaeon]